MEKPVVDGERLERGPARRAETDDVRARARARAGLGWAGLDEGGASEAEMGKREEGGEGNATQSVVWWQRAAAGASKPRGQGDGDGDGDGEGRVGVLGCFRRRGRAWGWRGKARRGEDAGQKRGG
ncbi:hypothetical protein HETIRDRAFT_451213 [Heterobasidion irregulare TC 32-1]|uniref:Uncharacterized protein n=1 Tax=Heterobasidion irregulare (strain TC 32-1) TaxID=747525 RepID=W4K7T5_HETIT|nr:uncharacterized protein HETIRDRAFT_451213 [Heterobasidion irregulare TC 32-1]ETW81415.1 hypothetical protein HETIRDRAFT_451213 [Heterobasidion irregulare TC 32-1]